MSKSKDIDVCAICGAELTEENSVGVCAVCLDCQSKHFRKIEDENGTHLAIFIACAAYDIPCLPTEVPIDLINKKGNRWEYYVKTLAEKGKLVTDNGTVRTFSNGVRNIRKIFGKDLTENDFARYISAEQAKIDAAIGTVEQRERWGAQPLAKNMVMTQEIYDDLDAQYEIWVSRYRGQTITPQLENSIITVCKRYKVIEHLMQMGDYTSADKVQKMIDNLMASEQMRKKDEKPVEDLKMDAFVVALENAGLMENGTLKTTDEVIEALRDTHIKSKKYNYSLDACDQMIFDYINNIRANADMSLLTTLPEDMQVEDKYGEFADKPTEEETKRKKYAGLTPIQFSKEESEGE